MWVLECATLPLVLQCAGGTLPVMSSTVDGEVHGLPWGPCGGNLLQCKCARAQSNNTHGEFV